MKMIVKAILIDDVGDVLLLRRSGTHPRHPHGIDIPGGLVEVDEKDVTALIREIYEETALVVARDDISFLRETVDGEHTTHLFHVTIDAIQPGVVVSWEHESYEWVSARTIYFDYSDEYAYIRMIKGYLSTLFT